MGIVARQPANARFELQKEASAKPIRSFSPLWTCVDLLGPTAMAWGFCRPAFSGSGRVGAGRSLPSQPVVVEWVRLRIAGPRSFEKKLMAGGSVARSSHTGPLRARRWRREPESTWALWGTHRSWGGSRQIERVRFSGCEGTPGKPPFWGHPHFDM